MKIQEIDKKIEAMHKILQIDISEQEYVKELGNKLKATSSINQM